MACARAEGGGLSGSVRGESRSTTAARRPTRSASAARAVAAPASGGVATASALEELVRRTGVRWVEAADRRRLGVARRVAGVLAGGLSEEEEGVRASGARGLGASARAWRRAIVLSP